MATEERLMREQRDAAIEHGQAIWAQLDAVVTERDALQEQNLDLHGALSAARRERDVLQALVNDAATLLRDARANDTKFDPRPMRERIDALLARLDAAAKNDGPAPI